MYFRKKKIKNSNLLQLVESYRNEEGKPRQRVVVSLGDARLPEGEEKTIAKSVEAFAKGERELLPAPLSEDGHRWVDRICKMLERSSGKPDEQCSEVVNGVLSEKVEAENVVELGPAAVGMKAWSALGIDAVLKKCGMNRSQRATAALLCVNRLAEPLSELGVAEWADTTALPELLDIRMTKAQKDRLYRTSDKLMDHREAIEKRGVPQIVKTRCGLPLSHTLLHSCDFMVKSCVLPTLNFNPSSGGGVGRPLQGSD